MDERLDLIRFDILEHLNNTMKQAKNENMQRQNLRQIQHALRGQGYSDQEIAAEVTYLKGQRYLSSKSITVKLSPMRFGSSTSRVVGRARSYSQDEYYISPSGRDQLEGQSQQFKKKSLALINIGSVYNGGAMAIGDGNTIIYKPHAALYEALGDLQKSVIADTTIDATTKANAVADIETLRSQVAKQSPLKAIVGAAWGALEFLSKVETAYHTYQAVASLIKPLLPL